MALRSPDETCQTHTRPRDRAAGVEQLGVPRVPLHAGGDRARAAPDRGARPEATVRLVLFEKLGQPALPGLLTERGVVSIADVAPLAHTPQATMQALIEGFDALRSALERKAREGEAQPLEAVRLRAPLPRPGKILACIANYWEHGAMEARPLNMFLKNADAVIGPGDTIVLPEHTEPWIFMHEAELALVIKGPAKSVKRDDWKGAVFGYTGMIDVSARGEGRRTWKTGSWLGKSFDTFAPDRKSTRLNSSHLGISYA